MEPLLGFWQLLLHLEIELRRLSPRSIGHFLHAYHCRPGGHITFIQIDHSQTDVLLSLFRLRLIVSGAKAVTTLASMHVAPRYVGAHH